MHPIFFQSNITSPLNAAVRSALILGLTLLFGACSGGITSIPVEEREVQVTQQQTPSAPFEDGDGDGDGNTATPLEERDLLIEQARRYENIAINDAPENAVDSTLNAAEYYIQADEGNRAEQIVMSLDVTRLNSRQHNRYQIIRAYAEHGRGENTSALARLRSILDRPESFYEDTRQQRVDALLLASFIYQSEGQEQSALIALLDREGLLVGEAKAETSRYIWRVINTISIEKREQIMALTSNFQLRNRLEQSLTGLIGEQHLPPSRFEQWREIDSIGPTRPLLVEHKPTPSVWSQSSPRSIAILLPESSRYRRAAMAVKDGIRYQHQLNNSSFRPIIDFYDVGSDPWQVTQYYAAAEQRGSELIIGPLGKDYADTLVKSMAGQLGTPILLLGGELPLSRGVTRLDLSPERESQRIAERAATLGYVNAVVLAPNTQIGERAATAFSQHWLQLGGKVSKVVNYSPHQFDHSTEISLMFDLNHSQARYRTLSDTLGYRPKFAPYRRNDIDFIYLVADAETGRIVRPQINFFGGNQMPVIASSSVYNGIEAVAENMDLNNTSFPAMPWELTANDVAPYAGQLNRLFALGSDAYQLAAELKTAQHDPARRIQGNTGTLTFGQGGEVVTLPVWAVFRDGKVETDQELMPLDPGTNPLTSPVNPSPLNPTPLNPNAGHLQGRNSYNESNWNPRQSRRKSGS